MNARLIFKDKKVKHGLIIEMVIWELDAPVTGSSHTISPAWKTCLPILKAT